ncbi:hypothetical protein BT96DRAFT_1042215 [Gymnopus androsaceus JB14]|uniref:Uncharacterized protein n=1 Tax=Gymnopus androsaceus JB14 TaxID=1447944 RepID=A0A6A4I9W5_9AGAR|nr:hypothetical protein BT96DRAFT_1042215 [Gymnopus androsaceus JB14]
MFDSSEAWPPVSTFIPRARILGPDIHVTHSGKDITKVLEWLKLDSQVDEILHPMPINVFYKEIKAGKGGILDVIKSVNMIMGEVQLSTYSSLSDPNPYNAQYLDTLQKLAADHGIFIWPHPDANELAYSKSTLAYRLGKLRYKGHPVIRPTTLVLSCEQGFDLICSNHVVKQDKSAAGVNVFFKNKSQTVLEDFRAQWEATESYNWGYGQKPRFFAAPLNESLLSRGEVHCYFILGKLNEDGLDHAFQLTSANPDANNHADIMIDSDVSHLHP